MPPTEGFGENTIGTCWKTISRWVSSNWLTPTLALASPFFYLIQTHSISHFIQHIPRDGIWEVAYMNISDRKEEIVSAKTIPLPSFLSSYLAKKDQPSVTDMRSAWVTWCSPSHCYYFCSTGFELATFGFESNTLNHWV